jgi:hypothetical protein
MGCGCRRNVRKRSPKRKRYRTDLLLRHLADAQCISFSLCCVRGHFSASGAPRGGSVHVRPGLSKQYGLFSLLYKYKSYGDSRWNALFIEALFKVQNKLWQLCFSGCHDLRVPEQSRNVICISCPTFFSLCFFYFCSLRKHISRLKEKISLYLGENKKLVPLFQVPHFFRQQRFVL